MSVTIELSADAQARLEAEAARRGISLGQLVSDLAFALPAGGKAPARRLPVIGIGASGQAEP